MVAVSEFDGVSTLAIQRGGDGAARKGQFMKTCFYTTMDTPVGVFSIGADETGALVATVFGDRAALAARGAADVTWEEAELAEARAEFTAYFADAGHAWGVRLAAAGSAFQQRVWAALREIPRGETRSYGELARVLGSSARAVGRGNATNPLCVVVPCHRVIGADGSLTGFAFGTTIKQWLLDHEAGGRTGELPGLNASANQTASTMRPKLTA